MSITAQNSSGDSRFVSMMQWLKTLQEWDIVPDTVRPASSDASFRRYFRVDGDGNRSFIVMDAPPEKENIEPFVKVAALFGQSGVSVPQVLAQNTREGFLLLSDLGTTTYLDKLDDANAGILYQDAIGALLRIQQASRPHVLPEYDRATLKRELDLFPEWYIGKHMRFAMTPEKQAVLEKTFNTLLANNLSQPQVFVHRDYHSRNLMHMSGENSNPGILDFQDALYGPLTYDLVSLLRDAYIEWDEERVLDWVIRYWEKAKKAGLPVNPDIDQFYKDFEWMGVQRHLKVLGIFARLYHRDGKEAYLKDIPLVMKYASKTAHRYNELAPLARLLDELQDNKPDVTYSF